MKNNNFTPTCGIICWGYTFWRQLSSSWLETSVSNSKYIDPVTIRAINVFVYSIWWLAGQWLQPISPTRADFGGFQVPRSRSLILTPSEIPQSEKCEKSCVPFIRKAWFRTIYLESRLRPRPLTKKTYKHPSGSFEKFLMSSQKKSGWEKVLRKFGRKKNITFLFCLGYQNTTHGPLAPPELQPPPGSNVKSPGYSGSTFVGMVLHLLRKVVGMEIQTIWSLVVQGVVTKRHQLHRILEES